jgi:hypothetical protein
MPIPVPFACHRVNELTYIYLNPVRYDWNDWAAVGALGLEHGLKEELRSGLILAGVSLYVV